MPVIHELPSQTYWLIGCIVMTLVIVAPIFCMYVNFFFFCQNFLSKGGKKKKKKKKKIRYARSKNILRGPKKILSA